MDENSVNENMLAIFLTRDELVLLSNSINEALELVDDFEFSTRVGYSRDEAEDLWRKISDIIDATPVE